MGAWVTRTKSSRPEGPKAGPKGRQLEVGARRAPRLLVLPYSLFVNKSEKNELWVPFYVIWVPFLLKIGSPFLGFLGPLLILAQCTTAAIRKLVRLLEGVG